MSRVLLDALFPGRQTTRASSGAQPLAEQSRAEQSLVEQSLDEQSRAEQSGTEQTEAATTGAVQPRDGLGKLLWLSCTLTSAIGGGLMYPYLRNRFESI